MHAVASRRSAFVLACTLVALAWIGACEADAAPPRDAAVSADAGTNDAAPSTDATFDADPPTDADTPDAAPARDAAPPPADAGAGSLLTDGHEVLFVGNSYTYANDLPSLHRLFAGSLPPVPVRIDSVTAGGYTLAQHATDAATDGTALAGHLRTGTSDATSWDVVVLQEQSQTPGFPEGSPPRRASEEGAASLARLAATKGAAVLLFATWGRARGDAMNPTLYPDFLTMEARLEEGYRALAASAAAAGARVRIAPVGPAFARVHADVVAAGRDPLAAGSEFLALYVADGSHPSARGTYLAACVILGAITGVDPRTLPDALGLDASVCAALRDTAAATLADPVWAP
jgi:hypothetical protein